MPIVFLATRYCSPFLLYKATFMTTSQLFNYNIVTQPKLLKPNYSKCNP